MRIRNFFALFWLFVLSINAAFAQNPFGQTLQISTHFRHVVGHPTWLLIVRDVETGVVSPYLFDIHDNDNFWIAFTFGHSYRVTASTLKFGPFAIIHNFCHIEDGILSRQSMIINVSGSLTPLRGTSKCETMKYNEIEFPIYHNPEQ